MNLSQKLYNPPVFLYSPKYECDSKNTAKAGIEVIWAIFAGRRDRLAFQEKIWVALHRKGILDELHLWDFTSRTRNSYDKVKDAEFIKDKVKKYDFALLQQPPDRRQPLDKQWLSFYQYYAETTSYNDVVVKVDDDVVFVNASEFKCFVNYVHEMQDVFTVSANIVNNGVVAHIQQLLGIVPNNVVNLEYPKGGFEGSLWDSADKCFSLHKYFTEHPDMFCKPYIMRYKERLSINFIAFSGRRAKQIYILVRDHKGDEPGITAYANREMGVTSVVYMRLVVAHLTFGGQTRKNQKLGDKLLALYQNATKTNQTLAKM